MFRRRRLGFLHFFPVFFLHAAPLGHLRGGKLAFYGPDTGYIFVGGISLYPCDGAQFFFYLGQVGLGFQHFIELGPVLVEFFGLVFKGVLNLGDDVAEVGFLLVGDGELFFIFENGLVAFLFG